jgi:hypothetical protein
MYSISTLSQDTTSIDGDMRYATVVVELDCNQISLDIRYKEKPYVQRNGSHGDVQVLNVSSSHFLTASNLIALIEFIKELPSTNYQSEFDEYESDNKAENETN